MIGKQRLQFGKTIIKTYFMFLRDLVAQLGRASPPVMCSTLHHGSVISTTLYCTI